MSNKTESRQLDRYEGAMIGVAVGDALGAPLEFCGATQIKIEHGGPVREMIGGGWLSVEPGEVTDDTQMTLAVAEGIAAADGKELFQIGVNFLTWYRSRPKDVGGTCAAVLSEMNRTWTGDPEEWEEAARRLHTRTKGRTAGNGALMRTVYPALWYKDEYQAAGMAMLIGNMTHRHPASDKTLSVYTRLICRIVNSEMDPEEARWEVSKEMRPLMITMEQQELQPSGYCMDSLLCAFDSIIRTDSFEEAVVDVVNRGGDADTIGAIAGGLAGAIYGANAIPARWNDALENEPNRRTVQMFHEGETSGNALLIRLADLARMAHAHKE